jgi:hypothetical protein
MGAAARLCARPLTRDGGGGSGRSTGDGNDRTRGCRERRRRRGGSDWGERRQIRGNRRQQRWGLEKKECGTVGEPIEKDRQENQPRPHTTERPDGVVRWTGPGAEYYSVPRELYIYIYRDTHEEHSV